MASCLWRPEFGGSFEWWRPQRTFRWRSRTGAAMMVGMLLMGVSFFVIWFVPGWTKQPASLAVLLFLMWFTMMRRIEWRRSSAGATVRALRRADSPWVTGDRVYRLSWWGLARASFATSNWAVAAWLAFAVSLVLSAAGYHDAQVMVFLAALIMLSIAFVTTNLWTERFVGRVQRGVCPACGHAGGHGAARCPECGEPTWFGQRLMKPRGMMHAQPAREGGQTAVSG